MTTPIEMISPTKMKVSSRGNHMTLRFSRRDASWVVTTKNASNQAYNRGMPMPRYFDTLVDVERAYKSFKGLVKLCNGLDVPNITNINSDILSSLKEVVGTC